MDAEALREALHDAAGNIGPVAGLEGEALRRGRQRVRRRVVGTAALSGLAVVVAATLPNLLDSRGTRATPAVNGPAVTAPSTTPTPTTPTMTTSPMERWVASLPVGAPTTEGIDDRSIDVTARTFTFHGRTFVRPGPNSVVPVAMLGSRLLAVVHHGFSTENESLSSGDRLARLGTLDPDGTFTVASDEMPESVVVSADRQHVAYTVTSRRTNHTSLVVADAADLHTLHTWPIPHGAGVSGYTAAGIMLSGGSLLQPDSGSVTTLSEEVALFADGAVKGPTDACVTKVALPDVRRVLWRNCRSGPADAYGMSSDRRWIVTSGLHVLDASGHDSPLSPVEDRLVVGILGWESPTRIVVSLNDMPTYEGHPFRVRCDVVHATCERAPELQAPPDVSALPGCQNPELTVTVRDGGVALGHAATDLYFLNTSAVACTLQGYPDVEVLKAAGQPAVAVPQTPRGYLGGLPPGSTNPPRVVLNPGATATARVEGSNMTDTGAQCARSGGLVVTPPGTLTATTLAGATRISCTGLQVHPVLSVE